MSNLIELQSQIEKLQKQANEIKSKDFKSTVIEIRQKMAAFGITAKDLQSPKAKPGRKPKADSGKAPKVKKVGTPVAAKYRGPNGESWTGRGMTPKWLAALVVEGRAKEEFAIKDAPPPSMS